MWKDYELPTTAEIDGVEYELNTDYREIIDIFKIFNDANLLDEEKMLLAMELFYKDFSTITNYDEAIRLMMLFINGNQAEVSNSNKKPLMSWEQDLRLIIPPVNAVLNKEVRTEKYLHWWSFLGAYMEIGECTFNTFVSIRDKKNRGKKLDANEEKIYKENKAQIDIKKSVDDTTQAYIDEIMGINRG